MTSSFVPVVLMRPAIGAIALVASTATALACDTRPFVQGVTFDSCGTPWQWVRTGDSEAVYICDSSACDEGTILQLTLEEMSPEDAAMSAEALLEDWPQRVIPSEMGDYAIEMAGEIARAAIGSYQGVLIPLRLTHTDGEAYTSLAFRVPREGRYVIANATGDTDQTVLRGFLSLAVENIEIED
jgi:hypothetical protein